MVDEQRPYRAIVLPFGLFQVIPNLPKLNPTSDSSISSAPSNTARARFTSSSDATTPRPPLLSSQIFAMAISAAI